MKPIVIISGAFNPLHGGHLNYIQAAAALGEVHVIVNDDHYSIRKRGSSDRMMPIIGDLKSED